MANKKPTKKLKSKKESLIVNPLLPDDFMVVDMKALGGNIKKGLGDIGRTALDLALTPVETLTGTNFYDPKMETNMGVGMAKASNTIDNISIAAAPTALNMVAPGLGTALQAAQTISKGVGMEDASRDSHSLSGNTQNAIMGTLGIASQLAPLVGGFTGNNATVPEGGGAGLMAYGGDKNTTKNVLYTTDQNDPRLKLYKNALRANEQISKFNTSLDSLKSTDPSQYESFLNKKFYNTKDFMELNDLIEAGVQIKPTGKVLKGKGIDYEYGQVIMPTPIEYVKELPVVTPPAEPVTPVAPVVQPSGDPNFKYKAKEFTGFTENTFPSSMQTEGYGQGQIKAYGGPMDMTEYNGMPHEMGGIKLDNSTEVEGGETRVGDYIFSDRLKPEGYDITFAELSKRINKKYSRRQNDAPSERAMKKELEALMASNEKARIAQEELDAQMMEEDFMKYGGCMKRQNGGIFIDPSKRAAFTKLAKERGSSVSEYASKIMAYGGRIKYANGGNNEGEGLALKNFPEAGLPLDAFGNPLMAFPAPQPMNFEDTQGLPNLATQGINPNIENYVEAPQEKSYDFYDPNNKFGAKEVGYLASNIGGMYNITKGMDAKETQFQRFNPDTIDLSMQRDMIDRETTKGKNLMRSNVRNYATSAGQALSNLAAGSSALTDQAINAKMQSMLSEQTANTQIRNQAGLTNTQISNNEIIANEQNQAMADSILGLGLGDIGMNTQAYMRDKGMQRENTKYNAEVMDVLGQLGQHYNWTKDPNTGKYILSYIGGQGGKG